MLKNHFQVGLTTIDPIMHGRILSIQVLLIHRRNLECHVLSNDTMSKRASKKGWRALLNNIYSSQKKTQLLGWGVVCLVNTLHLSSQICLC
nr:hypothetical protein Q903MT_gene6585 [Picea sitchensis]